VVVEAQACCNRCNRFNSSCNSREEARLSREEVRWEASAMVEDAAVAAVGV
jgi:hypothetical protein